MIYTVTTNAGTVTRRSDARYVAATNVRGNVRFHTTMNAARERARRYGGEILDVTVETPDTSKKGKYRSIKCNKCGTRYTTLKCHGCGF